MSGDFLLSNANRMIGENARFVRQFQASQAGPVSGSNPMSDLSAMINPLIMLALLQVLAQLGYGGAPAASTSSLPAQTPGLLPASFPSAAPMSPSPIAVTPAATPALNPAAPAFDISPAQTAANPVTLPLSQPQNPAFTFISGLLNGNGSRPADVNLDDNVSIQSRIDRILFSSGNSVIRSLSYQLNAADPASLEAVQTRDRIKTLLRQEGRSDTELKELDLLWETAQLNRVKEQLQITAIGNPSEEMTARINDVDRQRTENARQWDSLYPVTAPAGPADMADKIRTALGEGRFTEADMGQSLKYLLDRSPSGTEGSISGIISSLTDSGNLNINAFLNAGYLENLAPERKNALLDAMRNAGLTQANNVPNSRFAGFLLENLAAPGDSATKTFLRQFLQSYYTDQNGNLDTPTGKVLNSLLEISGIHANDQQQLVFA